MTGGWAPIVDGQLQARALDVAGEITQALSAFTFDDVSLMGGVAGAALAAAYSAEARDNAADRAIAEQLLARAIDGLSGESSSLYHGFTGIAFVASHLHARWSPLSGEDPCDEIDEIVQDAAIIMARERSRDAFDLMNGLVGLGVYAIERLPRPPASETLHAVVRGLRAACAPRRGGLAWLTRPEQLDPDMRRRYPNGYFNLGLAHGSPGIIALLGQTVARGPEALRDEARALLEGAVAALLAEEREDAASRFAYCAVSGDETADARTGWCYGDPGVAVALLGAARAAKRADWETHALRIGLAAAERPASLCGVVDAGLCHGASGLAHLFNRLYQASGHSAFKEAAVAWLVRALDMRHPGTGFAGFRTLTWVEEESRNQTWSGLPGMLLGASGVALALVAASTAIEPTWDRVMLLSSASG